MTKGETYDPHSVEGRAAIDRAVRRVLEEDGGAMSRSDIAGRLRLDPQDPGVRTFLTASTKRGVRGGWATARGEQGQRRYTKAGG